MKKLIISFAAVVMMAGFSTKVNAQATENTAAAAKIVTPIAITETSSLHFGTLAILAGTPGTCVLSTGCLYTDRWCEPFSSGSYSF